MLIYNYLVVRVRYGYELLTFNEIKRMCNKLVKQGRVGKMYTQGVINRYKPFQDSIIILIRYRFMSYDLYTPLYDNANTQIKHHVYMLTAQSLMTNERLECSDIWSCEYDNACSYEAGIRNDDYDSDEYNY